METYKDMLQSPKWQKKRLEVFDQKGFKCEQCGEKEEQLAIHHKYYKKNHKPWEYEDDAYMVLCKSCHEKVHNAKKIVLTVKEAEIIMVIRECLNENEYKGLYEVLKLYEEYKTDFFFRFLPSLLLEETLLEIVREFIHSSQQVQLCWTEIRRLKEELSEYKTDQL